MFLSMTNLVLYLEWVKEHQYNKHFTCGINVLTKHYIEASVIEDKIVVFFIDHIGLIGRKETRQLE